MVSIARKNLFEDIPRFLVAQTGIMFAVSLVTIQTGVFSGFMRSTTLLIESSRADIWVTSDRMENFTFTQPFLLELVSQARQVRGVYRAEALMIGAGRWSNPDGHMQPLRIFGFDPKGYLFVPGNLVEGSIKALEEPYTLVIDRANREKLKVPKLGDQGTVGSLTGSVVGVVRGTQSIADSTFLFTSLESAKAYTTTGVTKTINCKVNAAGDVACENEYKQPDLTDSSVINPLPPVEPLNATDVISHIMIKAEKGQDLNQLKLRLEKALPGMQTYTKAEMLNLTQAYWRDRTGVGFILGLGAGVGMIVGVVIVGQILYASVSDHLKEFGTLKAMGAPDWVIYRVILEQALWMAVLGYVPGMGVCWGISVWSYGSQGIQILVTPATAAVVFLVTLVMCTSSAFFAIQKVTRVDPAIVFKA